MSFKQARPFWDFFSVSKCFCTRQCDQEQRTLLSLIPTWKHIHISLWIKPSFSAKKVLYGLNLSFVQNLRSWKCLWEVDVNSEYFSQAPLEVFEESNFHYFCLCSLLINSTRRLESPTVQKIEPGSEELMQSGHKLLFRQGLAMTHKKNIPCLWNTVSVNSLSIKSQMYKQDIKNFFCLFGFFRVTVAYKVKANFCSLKSLTVFPCLYPPPPHTHTHI